MMSHAHAAGIADVVSREVSSTAMEACAGAMRQAARGVCLAVLGFAVILSVTSVLIGIQELGATANGATIPAGQIQYR